MLGIGSKAWHWAAMGKHPTAGDYLDIGSSTPNAKSLFIWVASGYKKFIQKHHRGSEGRSWRFWIQIDARTLLCGLLRDSHDSVGRPYPLLIVGEGPFGNPGRRCWTLPRSLEGTWQRMEALAKRRFPDANMLAKELKRLEAPREQAQGAPFEADRSGWPSGLYASTGEKEASNGGRPFDKGSLALFPVGNARGADWIQIRRQVEACLEKAPSSPRAVFIGGTPNSTLIAFAHHPLKPEDFTMLWTA